MNITLTSQEMAECKYLAQIRQSQSAKNNLSHSRGYNPDKNPKKELDRQTESIAAEKAFCKAFNLPWQFSINNYGPDGIYFNHKGECINYDVKYSKRCPNLNIEPKKLNSRTDVFFYVTGYNGQYDVIGGIKKDQVSGMCFITDYGYKDRPPILAVPIPSLRPTESIQPFISGCSN